MSKIALAVAIVVMSAGASLAMDGYGFGTAGYYEEYGLQPAPGLRFSGANTTIMTGSMADPHNGYCTACSAGGVCVDWKLLSWYGSWDGYGYGYGHGGGRGCGRACGN
jgi:hypothetical protein